MERRAKGASTFKMKSPLKFKWLDKAVGGDPSRQTIVGDLEDGQKGKKKKRDSILGDENKDGNMLTRFLDKISGRNK